MLQNMDLTTLAMHLTGLGGLMFQIMGTVGLSDRYLLQSNGVAALLWGINNLMLGALSAAAMCVLNAFRQVLAIGVAERSTKSKWYAFGGFTILACLLTGTLWGGLASFITLFATVLAAYAMIFLDGAALRIVMGLVPSLWMFHATHYTAYWQIIGNSIAICAAFIGARRSYLHKKASK